MVRILGIDPGTQCVGFAVLELAISAPRRPGAAAPLALRASNVRAVGAMAGGDAQVVECGVLRLGTRKTPLAARLFELTGRFRDLVLAHRPDEVALEEAFYGKSVQAALRIGEARGVILAESARAGVEVHQFPPARVKRCVTGRGDATKDVVAGMVARLVRMPAGAEMLPRDATDAIGIALTRLEERRSPLLDRELG
ncbi:MAG: crossover junction endodeoxyribonuclease RuvC [Planctomycetes bacterium]|nr:crossover junction endodeoxyribonuclease RuvC [Planctomycetota bacterium]